MELLVGDTTQWLLDSVVQHGLWIIPGLLLVVSVVYLLWPDSVARPPGPTPWPLLGSYPNMTRTGKHKIHKFFRKTYETYGPVAVIHFGSYPCVLVSGYEAIREAFLRQRDNTIGRPCHLSAASDYGHSETGLVYSNGSKWRPRRRAVISGVVASMESVVHQTVVQQETLLLIQDFLAHREEPFDPTDGLELLIMTCNLSALMGTRYRHDDATGQAIITEINNALSNSGGYSPCGMIPILRLIPGINTSYNRFLQAHLNLHSVLKTEVERMKKSRRGGAVRSVLDALFNEQKDSPESILDENIGIILDECLTGGSRASAYTLSWALLYLADNLTIQRACQQEIDRECGMTLPIRLSDLHKLPYLSATLYEVQRIANVVPFALFHDAVADMTLNGFHIAKGTLMTYSTESANMDEEHWKDPHTFKPERFLTSAGKLANLPPAFMPLGIGARKCVGYVLAERQMILILAGLLQTLTFTKTGKTNYDGSFHFAVHPTENLIAVSKRKSC